MCQWQHYQHQWLRSRCHRFSTFGETVNTTTAARDLRGANIPSPDMAERQAARVRQAGLLKPPGSLGKLEALAIAYAAARGPVATPVDRYAGPSSMPMALAVFAADHGVAAEGVSAYPQSVTAQMYAAVAMGSAAIGVLARSEGIALSIIDVGLAHAVPPLPDAKPNYASQAPIRAGSGNIVQQAAMTPAELERALLAGAQEAARLIATGAVVLGVGEVGIGNTTAAAAQLIALTGCPVREAVGRGTGVDDDGLLRKVRAVEQALVRSKGVRDAALPNSPAHVDTVLCELSGLELVAMTGFMLHAASARIPVVVDGFLACSAAVCAFAYAPTIKHYLFAAHVSVEPGASIALAHLGIEPMFNFGLRLGEGTGAALGMGILRKALLLEREMGTFADIGLPMPAPRPEN
jgi:nicotinate-nucleotide--dimethylbenzimidazole phosphoribosyltransferase